MNYTDLLGDEVRVPVTPAPGKRREPTPAGYYAPPGTGPTGETYKSCEYSYLKGGVAGRYFNCRKALAKWTGGRKTDILLRSPGCSGWEARTHLSGDRQEGYT